MKQSFTKQTEETYLGDLEPNPDYKKLYWKHERRMESLTRNVSVTFLT